MVKEQDIWLLKAALYPQNEATQYWSQWVQALRFNDESVFGLLEDDTKRLLPLVYRNLQNSCVPHIEVLKEIYKKTWLNNQRLLLRASEAIRTFEEQKVSTMILKGMALSLKYYKDMGMRPMGDIDVLVQPDDIDAAFGILTEMGHTFIRAELKFKHLIHAYHSFNPEGIDIDIHRQLFYYLNEKCINESFWEERQELKVMGAVTTCLSDTHQMLHTLVHGAAWGHVLPNNLRWIADAWFIDKNVEKPIDWQWIINLAVEEKMVVAIKPALLFLVEEMKMFSLFPFITEIKQLKMTDLEIKLSKRPNNLAQIGFVKLFNKLVVDRIVYKLYYDKKVSISLLRWQIDRLRLGIARRLQ